VTSEKRQPLFPDLPPIGETVPGFESVAWFGVFAPAKLPDAINRKNSTLSSLLRLQNRNCAIN
jgi:tripartite-type tricarboxylate transporter receptor subunit TctC